MNRSTNTSFSGPHVNNSGGVSDPAPSASSSSSAGQQREGVVGSVLDLYDSAILYCRNTSSGSVANAEQESLQIFQQLQWGVENFQRSSGGVNNQDGRFVMQDDFPDDLLEECDVGPRPFRQPIFPNAALVSMNLKMNTENTSATGSNTNPTSSSRDNGALLYAEILMMYNKGLVYHFSRADYGEAMKNYEAVDFTLSKLMPQLSPPLLAAAASAQQHQLSLVLYQKLMELRMRANNNMGQITYMLGLEDTAQTHFEAALVFAKCIACEEASNELKLDTANVLSNWCRVHYMSGNISDDVHQGLEEVLRIRSSILGWKHRDVASAHYNLGVAKYSNGFSDDALSHLFSYLQVAAQEAKEIKEASARIGSECLNLVSKQPLDPIPALIYILLVKNEHKGDEIAQELVRGLRSLQEKRADVGPQGPEVASVLNFIGTLLFHQQDYEHALLFFQEELRLEENLIFNKDDDVSISVTCNNVGRILQELNRLPEAKHYYHRALKAHYGDCIEEWCASPKGQMFCPLKWNSDHLQELPNSTIQLYSAVWYNLGLIHDKLGFFGEATNSFQVSLGLRRAMLGPNHADVACLLYNIGVLQMEQQMLQEATASFREALRIRQISPVSGHLNDCHVIQTLKKLASLYKAKGNIGGALETLHEILTIQKSLVTSTAGAGDSLTKTKETGATLRDIAELYHAEGKLESAAAVAQESIGLFRKIQIATAGTFDFVACTEELVAGLLLLGSLNHEICMPDTARQLFQEASAMIRQVSTYFPTTELDAMHEVTLILSSVHCAPQA